MYIAPEEDVHGEIRRRQPERDIFGQVLAMLHLRVDDDGAAVIAGLDAGGFGSLDDLLDGAVAVGVDENLQPCLVRRVNEFGEILVGQSPLPCQFFWPCGPPVSRG